MAYTNPPPRSMSNIMTPESSPTKRVCICFEAPRVSDGTHGGCQEGFKPTDEFSEFLGHKGLELVGQALATATMWPAPSNISQMYGLNELPQGFSMLVKWDETMSLPIFHISGHSSGKCFTDVNDFIIHLLWLYGIDDLNDNPCNCALCLSDPEAGDPATVDEYRENVEGPWFPVSAHMPLYHPLMKPAGVTNYFEMLGPIVPAYDVNALRTGVLNKARRAPPPAIQVNGHLHPNGVLSAPVNMSKPMPSPLHTNPSGPPHPSSIYPVSPMFTPGMGYLYGTHIGAPAPSPADLVQIINHERNSCLIRAAICGQQMNQVIGSMNRAGLQSPIPPVGPMSLPPILPQHVATPGGSAEVYQQFPIHTATANTAVPQQIAPQHRQAQPQHLPSQATPRQEHTPLERVQSATVPLYQVISHPVSYERDSSVERQKARGKAHPRSPTYKGNHLPTPTLSRSGKVKKALATAAKPSSTTPIAPGAYANSFEAAISKGGRMAPSTSSDDITVIDAAKGDTDPEYEVMEVDAQNVAKA